MNLFLGIAEGILVVSEQLILIIILEKPTVVILVNLILRFVPIRIAVKRIVRVMKENRLDYKADNQAEGNTLKERRINKIFIGTDCNCRYETFFLDDLLSRFWVVNFIVEV